MAAVVVVVVVVMVMATVVMVVLMVLLVTMMNLVDHWLTLRPIAFEPFSFFLGGMATKKI